METHNSTRLKNQKNNEFLIEIEGLGSKFDADSDFDIRFGRFETGGFQI